MSNNAMQNLTDVQAEEALLGSVLINPDIMFEIDLSPDAFTSLSRRLIWKAMLALHNRGDGIDLLTLSRELENNGDLQKVGGSSYLAKLSTVVPSSLNAATYAATVANLARRRAILQTLSKVAEATVNLAADPSEAVEELTRVVGEVGIKGRVSTIGDAARAAVDRALEMANTDPNERIVYWGLPTLDKMFFPEPGNFVVIGARPSVGKTAMLLTAALETAKRGGRVVFVSLEMSEAELGQRAVAILSDLPLEKLRRGRMDADQWDKAYKAVETLENLPLHIVEAPGANVTSISAIVERIARSEGGLRAVFIDYLGLVAGRGHSEYERTTDVSKGLQRLSKSLARYGAILVAAHQLNRAPEGLADKRPTLAHLRSSGQVEQDADAVFLLWRPTDVDSKTLRFVNIHAAKVRQGEADWLVKAALEKSTTRFVEVEGLA